MTMERFFEMPRTLTFEMPKLKAWVQSHMIGPRVLNLFGGKTDMSGNGLTVLRNDIRPDVFPDVSVDAYDVNAIKALGTFDCVLFDPPYSAYQAVHSYGGVKMQDVTAAKCGVDAVLRPGGRVISLCWNSTGMGMRRGYEKEHLLLVNSGGSHNDIIVLVERKKPLDNSVETSDTTETEVTHANI